MLTKKSKIFIAGHNGMVGSAILKKFKKENFRNLIIVNKNQLNLLNQKKVSLFLKKKKPDYVIIAAARVGGIIANSNNKASFIYENLQIQNNLIHASFINGVKNLIVLGSSCVYPKNSRQPIKEKYLLSNYLEKTNEPYAIAKIAGINLCESYNYQYSLNYKSLMPTNSYGYGDSYDLKKSHFFSALIKKIHIAKLKNKKFITLLGTGKAKRELIFVDDIASGTPFAILGLIKSVIPPSPFANSLPSPPNNLPPIKLVRPVPIASSKSSP